MLVVTGTANPSLSCRAAQGRPPLAANHEEDLPPGSRMTTPALPARKDDSQASNRRAFGPVMGAQIGIDQAADKDTPPIRRSGAHDPSIEERAPQPAPHDTIPRGRRKWDRSGLPVLEPHVRATSESQREQRTCRKGETPQSPHGLPPSSSRGAVRNTG